MRSSLGPLQDIFKQGKTAMQGMRGSTPLGSSASEEEAVPEAPVAVQEQEEAVQLGGSPIFGDIPPQPGVTMPLGTPVVPPSGDETEMAMEDFTANIEGSEVDLSKYDGSSVKVTKSKDGTIVPGQIEQHKPKARMAPGADSIERVGKQDNRTVYQKVCDEWTKVADPATGFEYFCSKYVYINNQKHGYVNFKLYGYQKRLVKSIQNHKYVITRKFRQAGASLLTGVYCLWYSLTHPRKQAMIVSIGLRESSKYLQENVREIYEAMPKWLKGGLKQDPYIYDSADANTRKEVAIDHSKIEPIKWKRQKAPKDAATEMMFPNLSKIRSVPTGKAGGRGFSTKLLVIDEAAFIEGIREFYVGAYPTINNTGGSVFVVSTVNGVGGIGGWYYETYKKAEAGENKFQIAHMEYTEHPDYNDPEWVEDTKANLGDRGWRQEVLGEFLASGNTYIDGDRLNELGECCIDPIRKEYGNRLWVWEDPVPGHHYGLSADCATKGGLDYSAFHVIDYDTGNQVAEYRHKLPEDDYAKVLAEVGYRYGTALITPELNAKAGGAVTTELNKIQRYKRLYRQKNGEVGWNTTVRTRDTMLSYLESSIESGEYTIRSSRLVDELKTFIVTDKGKVEADSGCHDDVVMSWTIGLCPEVVRAAMRQRPVIPINVTTSEADTTEGFSGTVKPVYSDADEKRVAKAKREGLVDHISAGAQMKAMSEINDQAGEDVLSWLLG